MSGVQSIDRMFHLLEIISDKAPITLLELVEESQLTKTTTHRLLNALIENNYVKKNDLTKQYELTYKLFELGNKSVKNIDYLNIAKSLISRLAIETGETCHLVIEDNHEILYIEKFIPNDRNNTMASKIGKRMPMYCTAVGKSILSAYNNDHIKQIWDETDIQQFTQHTITDYTEFVSEINQIRLQGYAEDKEENELGIRCIGSHFVNHRGDVQGAISLSFPKNNIAHSDVYIQKLLEVTTKISQFLGASF